MDYTYGPMLLLAKDITIPLFIYGVYFYVKMAKYKSLVSTLFIYNKICENVKKLENWCGSKHSYAPSISELEKT